MRPAPSTQWTTAITKAACTLLLVGVVAYVVWWLLEPLLPLLLVALMLLAILRLALGWFRRDSW